jgi:putative membrane protein
MNKYQYRFLQSMITSGLAAVLMEKLLDGKLSFFINLRFAPLTMAGIVILLIISGIGAYDIERRLRTERQDSSSSPLRSRQFLFLPFLPFVTSLMGLSTPVFLSVYGLVFITGIIRLAHMNVDDQAGNTGSPAGIWSNLILVAIPLIILVVVPTKPLSVETLSTRGINMSAPITIGSQSPVTIKAEPTDRTILDWVTIFDSEPDSSKYLGVHASVIGFVYHDDRLTGHNMMVGRFTITCCVADAFAVGLVVDSPDSTSFDNDTWVKVVGTLDETTVDGVKVPLIHATSVTAIDAPAQPYLYP